MSPSNYLLLLSFLLFQFVGRITAVVLQVPLNAYLLTPITTPASATFTSIPNVGDATALFQYAATNTSIQNSRTTYLFRSYSYISPTPTCVTAIPVTTTSGGKVTSTTTRPYCAVVTSDGYPALACAPEVENLLGKLWLQGSFKGVTEQPAAATLITNAWSNSHMSKRGVETGAFYAIEAIAWIFAAGVTAGKTYQDMFGHGPLWGYRAANAASAQPVSSSIHPSSTTTSCKACQTCFKNLTPLIPTAEYVVVPMTIQTKPTVSTHASTTTKTTSAGPLQTSGLGCLKDTTEDPNHMYFYRQEATVLIPSWCNAIDPDGTEDHDIGAWDATETQPVARAGVTGSTQLRMWMGVAPGETIPNAKKADWKANCQALLNTALTACDKKLGNKNPQPMDVMYGGWVISQGVLWRLQGQKLGAGNFVTLTVKPPGNVSQKRSLATDVEGVVKWAKRCLNSSKSYVSSIVVNLISRPASPSLSLYGIAACSEAADCTTGYVAAEWTSKNSSPDICSEPSLDFHIVHTNTSNGMNGGGIQFSSFGGQFCEFKKSSESTRLSYGEGIFKHTAHIESGREIVGGIVCRGDSGASIVGTCFVPEKQHSGTYRCPEDWRTTGMSNMHGTMYKMMAECFTHA